MTTYDQKPCEFKYKIDSCSKVVDGDTVDVLIDLGFDVLIRQRVRLLGIDTEESRTRDLTEKVYGKHAKKKLAGWVTKAVECDKDDIEIELRCQERDSVGKYGRALGELWVFEDGIWTNVNKWMCEQGYAVPYVGQNKDDVKEQHMVNRRMLSDRGELIIDETGTFLSSY
jgi:micrococcal nuclease